MGGPGSGPQRHGVPFTLLHSPSPPALASMLPMCSMPSPQDLALCWLPLCLDYFHPPTSTQYPPSLPSSQVQIIIMLPSRQAFSDHLWKSRSSTQSPLLYSMLAFSHRTYHLIICFFCVCPLRLNISSIRAGVFVHHQILINRIPNNRIKQTLNPVGDWTAAVILIPGAAGSQGQVSKSGKN